MTESFINTDSLIKDASEGLTALTQLVLSVFVDSLAEKAPNARRSLHEGQTRFVKGVFRVA